MTKWITDYEKNDLNKSENYVVPYHLSGKPRQVFLSAPIFVNLNTWWAQISMWRWWWRQCNKQPLWAIVGGVKASMDKPFALRSATVLDKEFHGGVKNTKKSLLLLYRQRQLVYITLMQGSGAAREYTIWPAAQSNLEAPKVWTFRMAKFNAQKHSGRNA